MRLKTHRSYTLQAQIQSGYSRPKPCPLASRSHSLSFPLKGTKVPVFFLHFSLRIISGPPKPAIIALSLRQSLPSSMSFTGHPITDIFRSHFTCTIQPPPTPLAQSPTHPVHPPAYSPFTSRALRPLTRYINPPPSCPPHHTHYLLPTQRRSIFTPRSSHLNLRAGAASSE